MKDGYGRMTWPDGQTYCGGFKRNKRCGRGVQTAADGEVVHCGLWENDHPVDESGANVEGILKGIPENITVGKGHERDLELSPTESSDHDETINITTSKATVKRRSKRDKPWERDISSPHMLAEADDDDESCDLEPIVRCDGHEAPREYSIPQQHLAV